MNIMEISKYDPSRRRSDGSYTVDEWTSIYDAGPGNHYNVSLQSYLAVETSYVRIIEDLALARSCEHFCVVGLVDSRENFQSSLLPKQVPISDGELDLGWLGVYIRSALRGEIYATFRLNSNLAFQIVDDMYLFIISNEMIDIGNMYDLYMRNVSDRVDDELFYSALEET